MIIGVPKEIKNNENRVAVSPAVADMLIRSGHRVLLQSQAGAGSGFSDDAYEKLGCKICLDAEEIWHSSQMVVKVKEPEPEEYRFFRENQILFAFLHLAANQKLTKALAESGVTAIAYETIQLDDGSLPLLIPMSEIAGRMAVQVGAQLLEKIHGGKGILLSGAPGTARGRVTIIGGGTVGMNAAKIAAGLGADVTIMDNNPQRLRQMDLLFGGRVSTLMSHHYHIAREVPRSDLVVGAVLIAGARAPTLVTEDMVKAMEPGSVIVDVAVDQGGIFATTDRATTHANPTYEKYGVLHYAVSNMPGAVPKTSTAALTNATAAYLLELANRGLEAARQNPSLLKGINVHRGKVTCREVADSLNLSYEPFA
jgi:alanine dehydrogenase